MEFLAQMHIIRLMFFVVAIIIGLLDEFAELRFGLYKHAIDTIFRRMVNTLTNFSTNEQNRNNVAINEISNQFQRKIRESFQKAYGKELSQRHYGELARIKDLLQSACSLIEENDHPYGILLHQFIYLRDISIISFTDLLLVYLTYVWFSGVKPPNKPVIVIETPLIVMAVLFLCGLVSLYVAYRYLFSANAPFRWMVNGISLGHFRVTPRKIRVVTLLFFSFAPSQLSEVIPTMELPYSFALLMTIVAILMAVLAMDLFEYFLKRGGD